MRITKSQLKQIIKEELNEAIGGDRDVVWLDHLPKDPQGESPLDKSPRSKMMGPSPIAGQEDPSDTEGGYTMAPELESDLEAKILAALETEFGVGSVMTDADRKASRDARDSALSEPLGPDPSGSDRLAQRIARNRKRFPRST